MYPHQIERLTEALDRAGLEALVATSAANVAYMTGFRGLTCAANPAAIFTRRGTALVVPAIEVAAAVIDDADVDHVVGFGDFHASFGGPPTAAARRLQSVLAACAASAPEALGLALDLVGARDGVVGLDESGLHVPDWERVTERLGQRTVVRGAAQLAAARRVKAPFEIECLERALRIAEEALNEVIQVMVRGTTEREAAATYSGEVVKRGAHPDRVLIAVGERTGLPLAWPTDRALRTGELIRFDVSCVYRGYYASVGRTGVLGEPTDEHEASYGAIQELLEAALDAGAPGRPAGAVFDAAADAARARGLARYQRPWVGHGVGLEACEFPLLARDSTDPLQGGEVLQIDVSHQEIGTGGVAVKETVLVAMAGARVLNRSARGLIALD